MAEYRGLTVRIGADTSRFSAALRATQSAIKETQHNLNDLKKAMVMDPGNKNASAMYVGELQSQAVAATSKVAELKRHIADLGNAIGKGPKGNYTTIGLLAEQTQNAALSAGRAKAAYSDVTDALAQVYTNLSALSHETFDVSSESRKEMIEQLKETGVSAKEAREQVDQLISTYSQGKKFDVNNSSIQSIEAELNRLVNGEERLDLNGNVIKIGGVLDAEEAQKTLDTVKRLKVVWEQYSDRNDSARRVNELHNEQVEVEKLNSQIKSLSQQMTQAAERSDLSQGLKASYDVLSNLEKEAERTAQQFKVADEAFKLDPTNPEAAADRMRALDSALEAAHARAEQLQNILDRYHDAGIDEVADGTKNLTQALADATDDANKANEAVIRLNSALDQAETKRSNDTVDGSATIFGRIEDYQRIEQELAEAEAASAAATARMNELKDAVDFKDKSAELSDVNNTIKDLENTLVGSAATFKAMADNMAEMYGNGLEQDLKESKDALSNLSKESEQARSHLDQLDTALQLDPSNMDKIAERSIAIGTAMEATKAEAEQLRSVIDSYTAAGIGKVAQSTPNLTQALEDARKKFDSIMLDLATASSRGLGDEEVAQLRDRAAEAAKSMHELESAMNLNEARSHLQELTNTYDELSNKADETAKHLKGLAEAEVNRIDNGISGAFESTLSDMDAVSDKADMAKARFDALDKSFEAKPTSLERIKDRMDALRDAVSAAKEKEDALNKAIADLKSKGVDKVLSDTKNLAKATSQARDKWVAAQSAVKLYKAQLAEAKKKSDDIAKSNEKIPGSLDEAEAEVKRLTQALNEAEQAANEARESYTKLGAANVLKNLEGERTSVQGALADFERESHDAAESISTSMYMALQEVGQYATRALSSVVDTTTSIDDALTSVRKTVDGTEEEYIALRDAAIASSKAQPIDASTIMEAEALGGQLGFNIRQVEEFARVATGLEVSTDMGWEEASTNMAQFFNIFQTNKNLVGNYGSAIVDLGNNFATTESNISQMASRIASAGTSIGMSEADVLGLSAALSSMGVKAEAGGSSISTIMTNIDKSVALGTEGIKEYSNAFGMGVSEFVDYLNSLDEDGLEEVASQFNMGVEAFKENTVDAANSLEEWSKVAGYDTAAEFAAAWSEEPVKALQDIFMGLDEATDAGGNLAIMLDNLGVTSIRQLDLSRRLASNPQLLADAVKMANDAWQENIALDTEVQRRNESLSAKIDVMRNSLDAVKAELGEGLVPILDVGVGFMKAFSTVLDDVPVGAKTAMISILGVTGALGTLGPVYLKAKEGIKDLIANYAKSGGALTGFAGKVSSLTTSIGALAAAHPLITVGLGLAIGVLAEFAIKAYAAKKRQDEFNKALEGMASSSESTAGRIDKIAESSKTAVKSIEDLTEEINQHNSALRGIQSSYESDADMLQMYKDVIMEVGDSVKGVAKEDIPADKLADLMWAIDGINQQLGTQFELQDFINGQYEDEQGQIQNTIESIDSLIAKREEEARAKADQSMYESAVEARMQATKDLADAEQAYADQQAALKKSVEENPLYAKVESGTLPYNWLEDTIKQSMRLQGQWDDSLEESVTAHRTALEKMSSDEQFFKNKMENDSILSANNIGFTEFDTALEEAGLSMASYANLTADQFKALGDSVNWDLEAIVNKLGEMYGLDPVTLSFDYDDGQLKRTTDDIRNFVDTAFQGWDIDWSDALERNGIELDDFAQKASDAGISLDDLKAVADNPSIFFSTWVDESMGDLDALIAKIQEYNDTQIEEKKAEVKTAGAEVIDNVKNAFASQSTSVEVTQKTTAEFDDQEALARVLNYKSEMDSVKKDLKTTAVAEISDAEEKIGYVITLANSVPQTIWININGDASNFNRTLANARANSTVAVDGPRAAGALRYHADGVILNRPTWIGGRDIAGEAGAEAIIPLTNRKYVQPFADTVADGMMSKLGQMTGTTNNYVINGLTVAPDSALAKAMDATFDEAKRLNRMGRR